MDLHVSVGGRGDRAARIYRALLDAVLDGRLRPGERLPPTRELARRLAVSRNTVAAAYDRLTAEGYLAGRVGAGTFVGTSPLADRGPRSAPPGRGVRPRPEYEAPAPERAATAAPGRYDFRVGVPDARLFPHVEWRQLVAAELRALAARPSGYGEPGGQARLRASLARYAGLARSVRAGPEDVLVTQGAQQALDVIGRVLIAPGDRVAVEQPFYPPARDLFAALGASVVGVPVDAEGLDVSAIPARTRVVYTTPSHQFPLGMRMSLARRAALLAWAERADAVVIEDDYDCEFRFQDRPLEPLQSLDRTGRVIYVGSFSKTMLPTLRLGFLVAPASLRDALRRAKQLSDWHGDLATQGAMARFIDRGLLARHIRRATRVYAGRRALLLAGLERELSGRLRPIESAAGLHVSATVAPDAAVDVDRAVAAAAALGVTVETLAAYGGPPGVALGYGAIPGEAVPEGVALLARAFSAAAAPGR